MLTLNVIVNRHYFLLNHKKQAICVIIGISYIIIMFCNYVIFSIAHIVD